jgi:hypothetical protein
MKHYNIHNLKLDDDELKYIIKLLSYFKTESPLDKILLRMKQTAYPDEFEDPIVSFRKTISYYNSEGESIDEKEKT